jgi:hypothetical protein
MMAHNNSLDKNKIVRALQKYVLTREFTRGKVGASTKRKGLHENTSHLSQHHAFPAGRSRDRAARGRQADRRRLCARPAGNGRLFLPARLSDSEEGCGPEIDIKAVTPVLQTFVDVADNDEKVRASLVLDSCLLWMLTDEQIERIENAVDAYMAEGVDL